MTFSLKIRLTVRVFAVFALAFSISGCWDVAKEAYNETYADVAMRDMELINQAISLHEKIVGKFETNDLSTIAGNYLQTLPKDPWGNDFSFDYKTRMLTCFGADSKPDGIGEATDIGVYVTPPNE